MRNLLESGGADYRPFAFGQWAGEDKRELLYQGITWWAYQLDELDRKFKVLDTLFDSEMQASQITVGIGIVREQAD